RAPPPAHPRSAAVGAHLRGRARPGAPQGSAPAPGGGGGGARSRWRAACEAVAARSCSGSASAAGVRPSCLQSEGRVGKGFIEQAPSSLSHGHLLEQCALRTRRRWRLRLLLRPDHGPELAYQPPAHPQRLLPPLRAAAQDEGTGFLANMAGVVVLEIGEDLAQ